MIRLLSRRKRTCDGATRREALVAGGLSLFGMTVPDALRAETSPFLPRVPSGGKAKNVILLYLFGGPSQHDTFDPKPDAPDDIRGEFKPISTSLPGVHFVEHLPRLSRWMDRSTVIRSFGHPVNDHSTGLLYTMTGQPPSSLPGSGSKPLPTDAPSMNAVIEYLARNEQHDLAASVWMPCHPGWGQGGNRPGARAGFLGRPFDPFITQCEPHGNGQHEKHQFEPTRVFGNLKVPALESPADITIDRLNRRRSLLQQIEDEMRRIDCSPAVKRMDVYKQKAFRVLARDGSAQSAWDAFDLEEEPPQVRQRYGGYLYGDTVLTARRLVERGVRFVTVYSEVFGKPGLMLDQNAWDTHQNHFHVMRQFRLPELDFGYSALCEDLQERGLLDETLVVAMGEMGRTPRINRKGGGRVYGNGRDHWSYCQSVMMTGAGIKRGMVHGASDKDGAYPVSDPVSPQAMIATIYAAMGIDVTTTISDRFGRPQPIAQHGEPVRAVLA